MTRTALLVLLTFMFSFLTAGSVIAAGMKKIDQSMSGAAAENLHSAKNFIGTEVRDKAGQKIGKIEDLAIDFNRGIGYAVVSSDEALRLDKTFLVPLSGLTSTHDGKYVNLTVSRDQLATIPRRDTTMSEQEYDRNLHDFYGVTYPWGDLPGDVPVEDKSIPGSNLTYPGPREVVPSEREVVPATPPGGTMDRQR